MRTDRYAVALLYGCCDGDGAGAPADALPFQQSVLALMVYELAMMRGDVYEEGVEILQLVDRAEQCLCAVALQRRQYFEREMSPFIVVKNLFYIHRCQCSSLQNYKKVVIKSDFNIKMWQ